MSRSLVLAAVSSVGVLASLGAQQPSPPASGSTFRAGTDAIRLDVSVLDRDRHPVKGLTAADFTILENSKPQSVLTFDAVEIPASVPATGWMRDIAPDVVTNQAEIRRVVAIVIDDSNLIGDQVPLTRQAARTVVDHLGPNDIAAVKFTWIGRDQDLTSDRRRLFAAVDSALPHAGVGRPPAGGVGATANAAFRNMGDASIGGRGFGSVRSAGGPPMGCMFRGHGGCVIDAMSHVAEALVDAPPGRKTLVFISPGGAPNFSTERLSRPQNSPYLAELFADLQRANINVYPIDPAGLTIEDGISSGRLNALRVFADNTGGRATFATNTPWQDVPQIFLENSSFYMLGFRSDNPKADGSFRRVEVRVNRPGLDVRTRSGYYATAPSRVAATASSTARTPVDEALAGSVPAHDLPLRLAAIPLGVPGQRQGTVLLALGFPNETGGRPVQGPITVVARAFDYQQWKEHASDRQTLTITPRSDAAPGRAYETLARLDVPPGRYEIRVAAAAGATAGSVFTDVEVPNVDKAPLSGSGLVLSGSSLVTAQRGLLTHLLPVVPTTTREFAGQDAVTILLQLYEGRSTTPEAVHVESRIVDATDRVAFQDTAVVDRARFGDRRTADYQVTVPSSNLGPGEYLLTVDATLGDETLHRDARFSVK